MVGGKSVLSFLAQVINEWAFLSLLDMLLLLSTDKSMDLLCRHDWRAGKQTPNTNTLSSSDLSELVLYNRDDITQCLYSHVFWISSCERILKFKQNGKTKTNRSQRSRHKLRLLPHKKRPTVVNHQTVKVCSLTVFLSACDYLSYICLPGWQNEKAKIKKKDNCGKGRQVTGVKLCNLRQVLEKNRPSGLVYCECVCIRRIWDKSRRVI